MPPSELELTTEDCRALLHTVSLGRVAWSMGALPRIDPVRFGVHGEDVVFRTPLEAPFSRALDGSVVAFAADSLGNSSPQGWSVVVIGRAELVVDDAYRAALGATAPPAWRSDAPEGVVRIPTTVITGRVLSAPLESGAR